MVQVFYPDEKTEVQDFKFIDSIRLQCNVLELVDNFGFLISFFIDKFIC